MTTLLILALFGLVIGFVSFRKPLYGLLSIVFLLPFERIGAFSLNPHTDHPLVRLVQIASAGFVLGYLGRVGTRRDRLRAPGSIGWLSGVLVVGLVPLLSLRYGQLYRNYAIAAFMVLLVYAVSQSYRTTYLKPIVNTLLLSASLVGLFGLYQYIGDFLGLPPALTGLRVAYTHLVFGFPRIQATAMEPLYYANYLLVPLFVALVQLTLPKAERPRYLWPALAIILLNFILTMSRGAFVAAAGGGLVLAALLYRAHRPKMRRIVLPALGLGLGVITLAVALTSVASYVSLHDATAGPRRFLRLVTVDVTNNGSYYERVEMQHRARSVFMAHSVVGVGIVGYGPYVLGYPAQLIGENWPVANNAFWELLAELGLLGFGGLIAGVGLTLLQAVRWSGVTKDGREQALLIALIAAFLAILIQYQSFTGFFLTHIWICLALVAGLSRQDQKVSK